MKQVFVCPMVRSGGSLINRLFEGVEGTFSYPFELIMKPSNFVPKQLVKDSQRYTIQEYVKDCSSEDFVETLAAWNIKQNQKDCLVGSNFVGGYLAGKAKGLSIKVNWNHAEFISLLNARWQKNNCLSIRDIHVSIYSMLFSDNKNNPNSVCFHSGNGLTVNPYSFFSDEENYMLIPIRELSSYVATEKMKYFRQTYELNRVEKIGRIPVKFFSRFNFRDLNNCFHQWEYCLQRAIALKMTFGDRVVLYKHKDLIENTEETLSLISNHLNLQKFENPNGPTIMGKPWGGNSQFKKTKGIDKSLDNKQSILSAYERKCIERVVKRNEYDINSKRFLQGSNNQTLEELLEIFKNYDRKVDVLYATPFFNRQKYKSVFG